MYERRLRKIFGSQRQKVTEVWRKFHDLYSSPNVIWVIKSRRMRWVGYVSFGGEERCIQCFGRETEGKV
jgi:hypothetical protein